MGTDWIDLNRSFVPHRPADEREQAAFQSYFRAREHGPLDWPRLLEHGRVVVLGEAGSGKTWEFQAQTDRLRAEGRTAFFIRVEQLADVGVDGALDPTDLDAFRAWRNSDQPATLFLDAVEEARLSKHAQFETALRRLAGVMGEAVARCSVILSSRITGWHANDGDIVSRLLGAGRNGGANAAHPDLPEGLAVVELAALNAGQVRQLAEQQTDDPDAFLDAIDHKDAWDFAGRPYDVQGLLRYWTTHGTLGSLTEIIEDDVARKLREDNLDRHHRTPLTPDKARQGAEALAAASVLSRRLTFAATGALAAGGALDPEKVLKGWTADEVRALLEQAIFDEAAFERVRFHHRHVSEYLAAGWLKRLVEAGAPRQAVADLLFRPSHGGTEVVPDALAPVAAWLAGKAAWVRKRLMSVDPDVLLEHGDPSVIPPEERAILLKRLMEHHRFRPGWTPKAQLHRLADPSLGPVVAEVLRDPELSQDQQELLLRLVAVGRLAGASAEAARIAAHRTQPQDVRRLAVEAVAMAGGREALEELLKALKWERRIPHHQTARLCERLYPAYIDEDQLLHILARTAPKQDRWQSGALGAVSGILPGLPMDRLRRLLPMLLDASRRRPWIMIGGRNEETGVSRRFGSGGRALGDALARLIASPDREPLSPDDLAALLEQLERLGQVAASRAATTESLSTALTDSEAVRRASFKVRVRRAVQRRGNLAEAWSINRRGHSWNVITADLPWVLDELELFSEGLERDFVFKVAVLLWEHSGRPRREGCRLRQISRRSTRLGKIFKQEKRTLLKKARWQIDQLKDDLRYRVFRSGRHVLRGSWRSWAEHSSIWTLRLRWAAFRHSRKLRKGRDWALLHNMLMCGVFNFADEMELSDRARLARLYGKGKTDCLLFGLKAFWRNERPPLPGSKGAVLWEPSTAALVGLSLEAADDGVEWWTPEEAVRASEHALHALNGFPDWLTDLAQVRPAEVASVLREQTALETEVPADDHAPHCVLSRLGRAGDTIRRLSAPFVAELLETRNIPNLLVLRQALAVLVRAEDVDTLARLAPPAVAAASAAGDRERLLAWLQVWLQADPAAAMTWLEDKLPTMPADDADALVLHVAAALDRYGSNSLRMDRPRFLDLEHAARLLRLLHRHVRREEDIEHHGTFSPGARDDAQQFRSEVFGAIVNTPGATAHDTLLSLSDDPSLSAIRDLLNYSAFRRATQDADPKPWDEAAVCAFEQTYTKPPSDADGLFALVIGRLADLRDDAENGDFAPIGLFGAADDESLAQVWLADQLETRSMGRYQVLREAEGHALVRPDIRIVVPPLKPVVIEVKWAHKKERSFENLRQALHDQLVGDYMKLRDSRHGILFIVNLDAKRCWRVPGTGTVDFAGLIDALRKEADGIMQTDPRDLRLEVVGVQLVPRPAPAGKAPAAASSA